MSFRRLALRLLQVHAARPGNGARYRLSTIGPGVTPDVSIILPGLHDHDSNNPAGVAYEKQQNALQDSIVGTDKKCRVH